MHRIMILEDDVTLAQGIRMGLKGPDIEIALCRTLAEASLALRGTPFDLLILDINLPDGSGMELLQRIRQSSAVPVILLTANDMEMDIVSGLESGADDYITKPFSLAVLRARVGAQLRRNTPAKSGAIRIDDFRFDFDRMEFSRAGQTVELSKTEQKLLRLLVENRGQTLTRTMLVDRIWTDGAAYVDENALSVAMKRLRDKLEETPSKPEYLKTVYGIGYTWAVK